MVDDMSAEWLHTTAGGVRPGDRVRLDNGQEMVATRVETNFMGRDGIIALVEDTRDRWYKQPLQADTELEVLRGET